MLVSSPALASATFECRGTSAHKSPIVLAWSGSQDLPDVPGLFELRFGGATLVLDAGHHPSAGAERLAVTKLGELDYRGELRLLLYDQHYEQQLLFLRADHGAGILELSPALVPGGVQLRVRCGQTG
jgi:hypothetical protein